MIPTTRMIRCSLPRLGMVVHLILDRVTTHESLIPALCTLASQSHNPFAIAHSNVVELVETSLSCYYTRRTQPAQNLGCFTYPQTINFDLSRPILLRDALSHRTPFPWRIFIFESSYQVPHMLVILEPTILYFASLSSLASSIDFSLDDSPESGAMSSSHYSNGFSDRKERIGPHAFMLSCETKRESNMTTWTSLATLCWGVGKSSQKP